MSLADWAPIKLNKYKLPHSVIALSAFKGIFFSSHELERGLLPDGQLEAGWGAAPVSPPPPSQPLPAQTAGIAAACPFCGHISLSILKGTASPA